MLKNLIILACAGFLLFVGCVTPQDLADLSEDWSDQQDEQRAAIADSNRKIAELFERTDLEPQERSRQLRDILDERDAEITASWEDLFDDLSETVETVEARTENVFNTPITGNPLTDLLAVLGSSGVLTMFATNKVRDKRRVARGERVDKPTA